ncbi:class I SAM-dependent methyltransferase [Trueperella pecoris]|nr:methyltransferase [Trueperella pecoris]
MMATLDQLILDIARAEVPGNTSVIVLDDPSGDLLRAVLDAGAEHIFVASRTVFQARAAVEIAHLAEARDRVHIAGVDGPLALGDFFAEFPDARAHANGAVVADVAIGHTPKSLEEVSYLAGVVPAHAIVFGANNKHMDRGHNAALSHFFSDVHASRGRGKFRCLVARGERTEHTYKPAVGAVEAGPIFGVGGVFAGSDFDRGGEFLAETALAQLVAERREAKLAANSWDSWDAPKAADTALSILDLGCGNGSVALAVLDALPDAHVVATDAHADAVVSAGLTLGEFGKRVCVTWDDAAKEETAASFDVVLLNPPFHAGTAVDATLVQDLLDATARLLRPGGRLYMVHNNHLRYRPEVEDRVGRTRELARNSKFTVLRADL